MIRKISFSIVRAWNDGPSKLLSKLLRALPSPAAPEPVHEAAKRWKAVVRGSSETREFFIYARSREGAEEVLRWRTMLARQGTQDEPILILKWGELVSLEIDESLWQPKLIADHAPGRETRK